jgi:predicted dehydrogenase
MIQGSKNSEEHAKLTYGMVGGGPGAFIGDVHRKAAAFDGKNILVAGSFSTDYEKTKETGALLGVDNDRLYKTYDEMAEVESKRDDGIDFVVIVTPNFLHYAVAKAFLNRGINVVCDKPLTIEVEEARELSELAKKSDILFCVTYTYTGYPAVKHARDMVKNGDIGDIRFVHAEYIQDWLATPLEKTGQKQSSWRTNPEKSGKSNCVGDIGSHIENMISYITGLKIKSLSARLDTFVEGRVLDDNASIMVNYDSGAKGIYWSSQVAIGHDNGLKVRIFGTKGSIEFYQEDPNYLKVAYLDKPTQRLSRGRDDFYPRGNSLVRIPAGHPEGYFVAFANIYKTFSTALIKKKMGKTLTVDDLDFPNAEDGIEGVKFIGKCVESSKMNATWVEL